MAPKSAANKGMQWHRGGCHCGAVAFEVATPDEIELVDCNCSMCAKTGYLHLIVPKSRFKLLRGGELLTTYTFNTGAAKHMFCKVCGIKSFYVPRSHPEGYSVNVHCLDMTTVTGTHVRKTDGRNWEQQYPTGRGEFRM